MLLLCIISDTVMQEPHTHHAHAVHMPPGPIPTITPSAAGTVYPLLCIPQQPHHQMLGHNAYDQLLAHTRLCGICVTLTSSCHMV
jgi:hypothetical protein